MKPDPTQFKLPPDIIAKLKDPNSGVKAKVKSFPVPPPPEFEVTVSDAGNNVIYNCARPCPKML